MKKFSMLICAIAFFSALSSYAACPCQSTPEAVPVAACPASPCSTCEKADSCCPAAPACPVDENITCKSPICSLHPCLCNKVSNEEIYKRLCLNQCQIDKACALHEKYKCNTQPIIDSLHCECKKLKELKARCASKCEIHQTKKNIKDLKYKLKCNCNSYEEDFKCLLTPAQLDTYNIIKKEQKCKCKELKKCNTCK